MSYKGSMARRVLEQAMTVHRGLLEVHLNTDSQDYATLMECRFGILRIIEDCDARIHASEQERARRNGDAAGSLPAPRSNHDGA